MLYPAELRALGRAVYFLGSAPLHGEVHILAATALIPPEAERAGRTGASVQRLAADSGSRPGAGGDRDRNGRLRGGRGVTLGWPGAMNSSLHPQSRSR